MGGRERILTVGIIGKIHRDFRARSRVELRAGCSEAPFFQEDRTVSSLTALMARKCYRQQIGTHFIFLGEQFWGRAARASWTRKSSGRSLNFLGMFLAAKENPVARPQRPALRPAFPSSCLYRRRRILLSASCLVSSEGRRVQPCAGSSRFCCVRRSSVGGDSEVDSDPGLGFDGIGADEVRLEVPLFDGFLGGAGEDGRTAEHAKILDQAIAADERLQNSGALHFHLAGEKRIAGLHGLAEDVSGIGGNVDALSGVAGRAGGGVDGVGSDGSG